MLRLRAKAGESWPRASCPPAGRRTAVPVQGFDDAEEGVCAAAAEVAMKLCGEDLAPYQGLLEVLPPDLPICCLSRPARRFGQKPDLAACNSSREADSSAVWRSNSLELAAMQLLANPQGWLERIGRVDLVVENRFRRRLRLRATTDRDSSRQPRRVDLVLR